MNSNLKTSEVLDLAADEIEARGWTQAGRGGDPWGGGAGTQAPVCLEGGILAAMGLSTVEEGIPPLGFMYCPAYRAVKEYLGDRYAHLFDFNDEEGRTEQEVIEVLRAAAAVERTKEIYETTDQPLPVEIPETSAA